MDTALLVYCCGGFFAGRPDRVPESVVPEPAMVHPVGTPAPVLAIWLAPADAERLLDEELPLPPARRSAVQQCLLQRRPLAECPPPPPSALGHQVLGLEGERAWTWVEAGLVRSSAAALGVSPGRHGLLAHPDAAAAVARYLNHEDLGPPVIWRPWLVTAHGGLGG